MSALELKIPPPVWFVACLGLAFGINWLVPGAMAFGAMPKLTAGLLVFAGLVFGALAVVQFARAKTTVHPTHPHQTSAIVAGGVYRLSRNPMYLGLVLILAGAVLWLGNPLAWPLPFVLGAVLHRLQILPEERILSEKFGSAFTDYMAAVPRWLLF